MTFKGIAWLALGVAAMLSSALPVAAHESYEPDIVYVCYWSGEGWRVASQYRFNADRLVEDGQAIYLDAFGLCPTVAPWDLGMDSTPMAGYCSWRTGVGNPSQGWYLGIEPAYLVADTIANNVAGTEEWLDWDGTCPDYPAVEIYWSGSWADELGVVHYSE